MQEFENPYALLNYDMDNNEPTPEFERATQFIDRVLGEMVKSIKSRDFHVSITAIINCFYSNLHWSSIQEPESCGDARIDTIVAEATRKLIEFSEGPEDDGGIGDTATDESIAYQVEELLND
jgi:hypothetical protein